MDFRIKGLDPAPFAHFFSMDDPELARRHIVRKVADSHRNRSKLQRLSFTWPMKVSQDGPPESCPGR